MVPVYPGVVLPKASWLVTVMSTGLALAVAARVTLNWATAPGVTVMELEVPVIDELTVSVAVTVCDPAVFRVTPLVKVCTPLSAPVKV